MITPARFFSDHPPERPMGVECEYNDQQGRDESGGLIGEGSYVNADSVRKAGYDLAGTAISGNNKCISNGGAIHPDMSHLEYGSPEGLGPREAAALDIAGITVMSRIVEASGFPHRGIYRISGSDTVAGHKGETSGYHENYMIPRSLVESDLIDTLLPAYAATCIWGLAGQVRDAYVFSQKVWGIDGLPVIRSVTRRTDNGKKPMFMIPPPISDEGTIGPSKWARVERRYADAGQSPEGRFLQFASMSLVLRIIEHHSRFDPQKLARLQLRNPAYAARTFAGDLSLRETAITEDGRKVTAQNIQNEFIALAYQLDAKIQLPSDESEAIPAWERVVDRFSASNPAEVDYGGLEEELDLAARHVVLANSPSVGPITKANAKAIAANLLWDRVLPEGAAQKWWAAHPSVHVPPQLIEGMLSGEILPRTRAAIRIREMKENAGRIKSMGWTYILYGNGHRLYLGDTFATS